MIKLPFIYLCVFFSLQSYGQDMKIRWSDSDGREFSISCLSAEFSYFMIPGDRIEYEPDYSDNAGKIKKIGSVRIEYEPHYSNNAGKIKKIGSVRIEYEPPYSNNAGKIKKIGGLSIEYEPHYSDNAGKIRTTRGRVL
jgi:hypothetical protein